MGNGDRYVRAPGVADAPSPPCMNGLYTMPPDPQRVYAYVGSRSGQPWCVRNEVRLTGSAPVPPCPEGQHQMPADAGNVYVVLGSHRDRIWCMGDRETPVLAGGGGPGAERGAGGTAAPRLSLATTFEIKLCELKNGTEADGVGRQEKAPADRRAGVTINAPLHFSFLSFDLDSPERYALLERESTLASTYFVEDVWRNRAFERALVGGKLGAKRVKFFCVADAAENGRRVRW